MLLALLGEARGRRREQCGKREGEEGHEMNIGRSSPGESKKGAAAKDTVISYRNGTDDATERREMGVRKEDARPVARKRLRTSCPVARAR